MIPLFFIFTKENIQRAVEQETSLLAVRRIPSQHPSQGEEKTDMLDELVMDKEQDELFKRYFNQAHAEVLKYIPSRFIAETPTDLEPVFREYPDWRQDRDFNLWLNAPDTFVINYRKSIDIKIEQLIVYYILYKWLLNKSPSDAKMYEDRLEPTLRGILSLLTKRTEPVRRLPNFP